MNWPPTNVYRLVTVILQIVLFVGLILSLLEAQWLNAFLILAILALTGLPVLMSRRFKVYIPPEFELLAILFIFASLFLGEIRDYYIRFWWWDAVLHMGSGFLLGLVGFMLVYVLNQTDRIDLHMRPTFVALFSFAFAMAAGALWEIFEFAMDAAFGMNMQKSGLRDTMWDLIVDALGAFCMSLLGYFHMHRSWSSVIFRSLESFVRFNPAIFDRGRRYGELQQEEPAQQKNPTGH